MIKQILSEEIAVVRGFNWAAGISNGPFNTETLAKQHGEDLVDIVEQDPKVHFLKQNHPKGT